MHHVFDEIVTERLRQDHKWGGPGRDDKHDPWDWVAILTRHTGLAIGESVGIPVEMQHFRKQMIRVAAVAIAAIESIDRHTKKEFDARERGKGY